MYSHLVTPQIFPWILSLIFPQICWVISFVRSAGYKRSEASDAWHIGITAEPCIFLLFAKFLSDEIIELRTKKLLFSHGSLGLRVVSRSDCIRCLDGFQMLLGGHQVVDVQQVGCCHFCCNRFLFRILFGLMIKSKWELDYRIKIIPSSWICSEFLEQITGISLLFVVDALGFCDFFSVDLSPDWGSSLVICEVEMTSHWSKWRQRVF